MSEHPLATLLRRSAVEGRHPPVDGEVEVLPPWRTGAEAVVSFTGHGVACLTDDGPARLARALRVSGSEYDAGFGGLVDPRTVVDLARGGPIDSLDLLLAAPGTGPGGPRLVAATPSGHRARVELAESWRHDVEVLVAPEAPNDGLVTLGRGIAGLDEMSVEVADAERGTGFGRRLVAGARGRIGPDGLVLAAVAPGNVASLRTFVAAGFRPVASVQLWRSVA